MTKLCSEPLAHAKLLAARQPDKFLRMHVVTVRAERALLRHRKLDMAAGDRVVRPRTLDEAGRRARSGHGELP